MAIIKGAPLEAAALDSVLSATQEDLGRAAFLARVPASLKDVPPPAAPAVNAAGELIVDSRLRLLFEHYLSALGEEPLAQVLVRIRHQLGLSLQGEALAQANALLEAFIQYRNQQDIIRSDYIELNAGFSLEQARAMQAAMRMARGQLFSVADTSALFAAQDTLEDYALARVAILQDASLNESQRQARLAEAAQVAGVDRASTSDRLLARQLAADAQLQADAHQPAQLQARRQAAFGTDAAQRLAARDQARAEWQARLARYRVELESLLAQPPVASALVQSLRAYHFSDAEQLRVAGLDWQDYGERW
ncbi:hypothetical protein L1F30_12900 [Simiduia sp. 21SJ11W-1]|uniref:lipase secretion chaperone n=1 Tax=Simiduia sp. 21SJ11W-1 TaxID=2909669 RepID=UPI0020A0F86F|nr:lipase secretion chaperone [Simiduia sp. 21SJ11W-1]UTA47058.1 hypothetical protein L1F30_12900 [Simiduia sp. 21SJ11W-1]